MLICLYKQTSDTDSSEKVLFLHKISSPIYVNSRELQKIREKKIKLFNSFIKFFDPDQLTKDFWRINQKLDVNENESMRTERINNNLKGLYNYLIAQNINNRIRNPIFLAIRFNNALSLYLDSSSFPKNNVESNITRIYKYIVRSTNSCLKENKKLMGLTISTKVKIYITLSYDRKNAELQREIEKIVCILSNVTSEKIQLSLNPKYVPVGFYRLEIDEPFIEAYKQIFYQKKIEFNPIILPKLNVHHRTFGKMNFMYPLKKKSIEEKIGDHNTNVIFIGNINQENQLGYGCIDRSNTQKGGTLSSSGENG